MEPEPSQEVTASITLKKYYLQKISQIDMNNNKIVYRSRSCPMKNM